MKYLLSLLLLTSLTGYGQKGKNYVLAEFYHKADDQYSKIVKKKWIDWKDGTQPGWYYVVKFDYGTVPPSNHEIITAYFKGGGKVRDWKITFTPTYAVHGDEFSVAYLVKCTNPKATYHPKECLHLLSISLGETYSIKLH